MHTCDLLFEAHTVYCVCHHGIPGSIAINDVIIMKETMLLLIVWGLAGSFLSLTGPPNMEFG